MSDDAVAGFVFGVLVGVMVITLLHTSLGSFVPSEVEAGVGRTFKCEKVEAVKLNDRDGYYAGKTCKAVTK